MDYDAKIAQLLALAEPLRSLEWDDDAAKDLPALIDLVNKLRSIQSPEPPSITRRPVTLTASEQAFLDGLGAEPKRGPGRPKKETT